MREQERNLLMVCTQHNPEITSGASIFHKRWNRDQVTRNCFSFRTTVRRVHDHRNPLVGPIEIPGVNVETEIGQKVSLLIQQRFVCCVEIQNHVAWLRLVGCSSENIEDLLVNAGYELFTDIHTGLVMNCVHLKFQAREIVGVEVAERPTEINQLRRSEFAVENHTASTRFDQAGQSSWIACTAADRTTQRQNQKILLTFNASEVRVAHHHPAIIDELFIGSRSHVGECRNTIEDMAARFDDIETRVAVTGGMIEPDRYTVQNINYLPES